MKTITIFRHDDQEIHIMLLFVLKIEQFLIRGKKKQLLVLFV